MTTLWLLLLLLCSPLCQPECVGAWGISTVPSESECRPYIEKALKERAPPEAVDATGSEQEKAPSSTGDQEGSIEETDEAEKKNSTEDETQPESLEESKEAEEVTESKNAEETVEDVTEGTTSNADESGESQESTQEDKTGEETKTDGSAEDSKEAAADQPSLEDGSESAEVGESMEGLSKEATEEQKTDGPSAETQDDITTEAQSVEEETSSKEEIGDSEQEEETKGTGDQSQEEKEGSEELSAEKESLAEESVSSAEDHAGEESAEVAGGEVTDSIEATESLETTEAGPAESKETKEPEDSKEDGDTIEDTDELKESKEEGESSAETPTEKTSDASTEETAETASGEEQAEISGEEKGEASGEEQAEGSQEEITKDSKEETTEDSNEEVKETEDDGSSTEKSESREDTTAESMEASGDETADDGKETDIEPTVVNKTESTPNSEGDQESSEDTTTSNETEEQESHSEEATETEQTVEDQLTLEFEAPAVRRPRDHIIEILHLSPEDAEAELLLAKTIEATLKDLKRLYDSAIKPLEILYKYRDLSNRHFGDPEIFSKPLILFMGPWSGGKSTILNYLLDNEFRTSSLRTGAEPSPAYFNILMWGERQEVLDGTQLAADWTFSGLQKFGQGLLDRLRGLKLNNSLLEKVNIVEIPGILEIRKQVERLFPFNDACQWFIDRADIIFLVYDPSKLDVGPETEAILDQLKGREYQTRIILNKADQVKPEELMRVQGTLIWNISPLMSSSEPPVMYSTSLWSLPYEQGSPSRLLQAQERAFLRDLRQAIDKRVENKIASARRFAVRVRNHAKMVDCYLTTYYNHKTFFGNRKKVADDIIEHPQNYHIYEGLSTLTNISRYDLPDPEVYRDFFRLNPLYDFQRLSDTCTYFRGCPINRLDISIAYDLPELVGKYKKQAERVLETAAAKETSKS